MEGSAAKPARAAGDRLSALPDGLLHRVLSFLPAQEVVHTTVLSKRWKDLWRSVPAINLNIRDFYTRASSDDSLEKTSEKMEDFTYNLLLLHKAPSLDAFRLRLDSASQDWRRHVDRWIRCAINDNPLVLDVDLTLLSGVYHLPHLGVGSSPCRLKMLRLVAVSLDKSFAEGLRSGCPNLEDLELYRCEFRFRRIQSNTLKNLVVCDCEKSTGDILVIRAPRLVSYRIICHYSYTGFTLDGVTLDAGTSLARASVELSFGQLSPRTEAMVLGSLYNVTSLELYCFQAMAVLDNELGELPIFGNLRTLSLQYCFDSGNDMQKVKALGRFLQKCPNLEKLTFNNFWVKVRPFIGPAEFPMLENLRTLCVGACDLYDNFQILCHFLRKSPNLEKLTLEILRSFYGREWNSQVEEEIFSVYKPGVFPMSEAKIY
ncbi:hypothetical protein ACP70R_011644 [Stipagrostis hirtigluma subsp. patula]